MKNINIWPLKMKPKNLLYTSEVDYIKMFDWWFIPGT